MLSLDGGGSFEVRGLAPLCLLLESELAVQRVQELAEGDDVLLPTNTLYRQLGCVPLHIRGLSSHLN